MNRKASGQIELDALKYHRSNKLLRGAVDGQWYVERCEHGGLLFKTTQFTDSVTVDEQHFCPSSTFRQQAEAEHRLFDVRCSPSNDKKVAVFWFCGVYRKKVDALDFLLLYHGQGMEGEAAKKWKWPTVEGIRMREFEWCHPALDEANYLRELASCQRINPHVFNQIHGNCVAVFLY